MRLSHSGPTSRLFWEPLLAGQLKAAASVCLEDIARSLREFPADVVPPNRLAPALADSALYLAYYARARQEPSAFSVAVGQLDEAIRLLEQRPIAPHLHTGLLKVAWVRAHLERRFDVTAGQRQYAKLDAVISEILDPASAWCGHFDLMNGLCAYAIYLCERLPDASAAGALHNVAVHLDAIKHESDFGYCWFTSPKHLNPADRAATPDGHYALGMAHGTAGVIAVLGKLRQLGIGEPRTSRVLEGAISWLLQQRRPGDGDRFARSSVGGPRADTFYGWCWGDVGIACALFSAAGASDTVLARVPAKDLAENARLNDPTRKIDACMCHGASGCGHIFNRIFQRTGDVLFQESASLWFDRALRYHAPGRGIGGFAIRQVGADGRPEWAADPTLLTGSSGIGLALLAAASQITPEWDSLFGMFF